MIIEGEDRQIHHDDDIDWPGDEDEEELPLLEELEPNEEDLQKIENDDELQESEM